MAKRKSPILAAILSLLIAGVGQFYVGRFSRGLILLLLDLITFALFVWIHPDVGGFLNLAVTVYSAYDAYKLAVEINRKIPRVEEDTGDMPEVYIDS
jgi:TM2 domain-containing membrane protein YozV